MERCVKKCELMRAEDGPIEKLEIEVYGGKKKKLNLSCGTDVGFCHCGITQRAACALGSHIFLIMQYYYFETLQ